MATARCSDLLFSGEICVTEDMARTPLDDPPPSYYSTFGTIRNVRYGIPQNHQNFLRIASPTLWFSATVTAEGSGDIRRWKSKFLQTITEACWNSHYDGGAILRCRLNTTHGVLKDGRDETTIFMSPEWQFREVSTDCYQITVHDSDSVARFFFREFSGDPFYPMTIQDGRPLQRLTRTTGTINFRTYLAVANEQTHSVVTLDEFHWTLTLDGNYNFDSSSWVPDDVGTILQTTRCNRAVVYENLNADSCPPFSLFLQPAARFEEVCNHDNWVPYQLPDRNTAVTPTLEKWVM